MKQTIEERIQQTESEDSERRGKMDFYKKIKQDEVAVKYPSVCKIYTARFQMHVDCLQQQINLFALTQSN